MFNCNNNRAFVELTFRGDNLPDISVKHFGVVDGKEVSLFTLRNQNGMAISVTNYGGIVTAIEVPDRNGDITNVVAGFDNLNDYISDGAYLGALVGPVANRIANGKFTLNDREFQVEQNAGCNNLHSASAGINKKVWSALTAADDGRATLSLTLRCPDGEGGFPGALDIEAVYTLDNTNTLLLEMNATCDQIAPLSLTSHGYFNLAGQGDVLNHKVMINAEAFTPVNRHCVPTGELRPVADTAFDFTSLKRVGQNINADDEQIELGNGYDHNFVLNSYAEPEAAPAAKVVDDFSGRVMTLWTNTPGMQFYSANCLGLASGTSQTFIDDGALCLEPQAFPDTPNHPSFPGGWIYPGEKHTTWIKLAFSTQP